MYYIEYLGLKTTYQLQIMCFLAPQNSYHPGFIQPRFSGQNIHSLCYGLTIYAQWNENDALQFNGYKKRKSKSHLLC